MRNPCRLQSTFGQWLLSLSSKYLKKTPAHKLLYLALVFPNILYKTEVLESMGSCPVAVALQPQLRMKECVSLLFSWNLSLNNALLLVTWKAHDFIKLFPAKSLSGQQGKMYDVRG